MRILSFVVLLCAGAAVNAGADWSQGKDAASMMGLPDLIATQPVDVDDSEFEDDE